MKTKKILLNFTAIVLSTAFALLLAEFGSRLFLNSSDFLLLDMVSDPVMNYVPSPSAMAGFDKWGFRNRQVPESADIVAVGDSHTYGNMARMVESWPYVLGRLTGRQVYNMGMGGYGPIQYFQLSMTKALALKPRMIIWGLYMGDDFQGAYSLTYGLDHWAYLRALPPQKVDPNVWEAPPTDTWNRIIRSWLSQHSVVYQLVFHSGLGDHIRGEVQIRNASQFYPGTATSLIIPEKHILEAFRPTGMLTRLELANPSIREGMRITFELIRKLDNICRQNQIQFMVVVIPTKEMVFSEYLEHRPDLPLGDVIDKLLVNERAADDATFKALKQMNIPFVYPLDKLKRSIGEGLYTKGAMDMHPNKNGYRVIAEAIFEKLKDMQSGLPTASAN